MDRAGLRAQGALGIGGPDLGRSVSDGEVVISGGRDSMVRASRRRSWIEYACFAAKRIGSRLHSHFVASMRAVMCPNVTRVKLAPWPQFGIRFIFRHFSGSFN